MKTILVVDDKPSLRRMLQEYLIEDGYRVCIADTPSTRRGSRNPI
jgi:DNA-binding response OmpR family regulator